VRADLWEDFLHQGRSLLTIAAGQGEGDIGELLFADILHDHVDDDMSIRDLAKDLRRHAWAIGNPNHRNACLILIQR
jgi:hypothetical protein